MHKLSFLAIAAFAALATIFGTVAASASIIGDPAVVTANGEAGYFADMNGPGHFTTAKDQFYIRKAAEQMTPYCSSYPCTPNPKWSGIGIQLGNDSSNNVAQLGIVRNGPDCVANQFEVGWSNGTLSATTGTNTTPLNSGGILPTFHPMVPALCVPQGDTLKLNLTEVHPGVYEAYAKDVTLGISSSKGFASLDFPDNAGFGVVQDIGSRSAPANNKYVHFAYIDLSDNIGAHNDGLLNSGGDWSVTGVASNPAGNSSTPYLVAPSVLTGQGHHFDIFVGALTGA